MTTKASRNLTKFPPPDYVSSEQTITAASVLTLAHGLGAIPTTYEVILRCKTADGGYSPGEEMGYFGLAGVQTTTAQRGYSASADATNIYVVSGATGLSGLSKSSAGTAFSLTTGNWRYVVKAWA